MAAAAKPKHFVAVHGVGHGAWVYYKLKPRIEAAGYQFTPSAWRLQVTLRGFGLCMTTPSRCRRFWRPFRREGYTHWAQRRWICSCLRHGEVPKRFVFECAYVPISLTRYYLARTPIEAWMDTQFPTYGDPPITALVVGPKFISESLYNLSPLEDQALGHLSVRPAEDKTIPPSFQKWQIENNPVVEVKEIKGADHMPMFTQPDALCKCLVEIAEKHG
ncbi:UNVERIFIED_CONTAM: putative methylesterase 19 [Sesamum radiatum]|uniref:Methylesterase 19 n=1 Tax=Sesamum radiatum TaxID=300843 RepID=A0AAW2WJ68_SESRA